MGRRYYSREFKREAVELSFNSDKTIQDIADELGISRHNLSRWRREYRNKGDLASPDQRNQKLTLVILYYNFYSMSLHYGNCFGQFNYIKNGGFHAFFC